MSPNPGRERFALVALAVTVTVAGCAGFGGQWATPSETVTPAPIPTSPAAAEKRGNSETGPAGTERRPAEPARPDHLTFEQIDALGERYSRQLSGVSYRLTARQRVVASGTRAALSELRRTVAADGITNRETVLRESGPQLPWTRISYDNFYNGSTAATRYVRGPNASANYTYVVEPSRRPLDLAGRGQFENLLRAYEVEFVASSPSGVVWISGETIRYPRALPTPVGVSEPRNGTIRGRIGPDGSLFVRATYNVTVGGDPRGYIVRTLRIDRVGIATVRRPDWLGVAVRRAR